jgi:hypothetical protein
VIAENVYWMATSSGWLLQGFQQSDVSAIKFQRRKMSCHPEFLANAHSPLSRKAQLGTLLQTPLLLHSTKPFQQCPMSAA